MPVPDSATLTLGAFEVTATVAVFEDRAGVEAHPDLAVAPGASSLAAVQSLAWSVRCSNCAGSVPPGVAPAIVRARCRSFVTVDSWVGVAAVVDVLRAEGSVAGLRESSVWVPVPDSARR